MKFTFYLELPLLFIYKYSLECFVSIMEKRKFDKFLAEGAAKFTQEGYEPACDDEYNRDTFFFGSLGDQYDHEKVLVEQNRIPTPPPLPSSPTEKTRERYAKIRAMWQQHTDERKKWKNIRDNLVIDHETGCIF